jgi:sugar lactone lactonase YvrE
LKTTSTGSITVLLLTDAVTGKAITSPAINLVALDSNGMIYVAATSSGGGSVIQTISETNIVTTLAGSGALGSNDGAGVSASFGDVIKGLAIDSAGNVYVADSNSSLSNNKIRKITRAGLVSTLAGSGAQGAADGAGSAASFNMGGSSGNALAVDSNFNVYLVEWPNADVRKITPAGVVSTFAGGGGRFGGADGVGATVASFANPFGITIDGAGNLYVLDGSNAIRMITPIGMVSTLVPGGVSVFAPDNTVVNQGGNSMTCIASATDGTLYAGNGVFIDSMWHSDIIKVSFH